MKRIKVFGIGIGKDKPVETASSSGAAPTHAEKVRPSQTDYAKLLAAKLNKVFPHSGPGKDDRKFQVGLLGNNYYVFPPTDDFSRSRLVEKEFGLPANLFEEVDRGNAVNWSGPNVDMHWPKPGEVVDQGFEFAMLKRPASGPVIEDIIGNPPTPEGVTAHVGRSVIILPRTLVETGMRNILTDTSKEAGR